VQAETTVEMCAAFCDGYAYFGVEYSSECYCSNELADEPAAEADCSMLCAGSTSQWCGGPHRLNLYAINSIPPSSSVVPFRTVPANVWQQMSPNYQAAASWVTVSYNYYCNGYGTGHTSAGANNMYVDDIVLVRADLVELVGTW
jgi:hypothetical protein